MRAIYYDTETTGVRSDKDCIIEIAAFDPVQNRTFEELVNPGIPIPPDASAIHGITDEMVKNAPSFAEIGKRFLDFCAGDDVVLIAHNNDGFDIHFLRNECNRHNLPFPTFKTLDTLKWARRYRPDLPRHSLQVLREVYGFAANNAHRALDDVVILHQVFSAMLDDLTIKQAYTLLNLPRSLRHMPFGKYQGKLLEELPKDYVSWLASSGAFEKPENKELKEALESLHLAPV